MKLIPGIKHASQHSSEELYTSACHLLNSPRIIRSRISLGTALFYCSILESRDDGQQYAIRLESKLEKIST